MVHLVLSSGRGNQGLRHFPYSGYLGLTPVRVEGVVATQIDAHSKSLKAKGLSVSVRCYESRQGPLTSSSSNLLAEYTQILWTKPDHLEYDLISNLEFPFIITLPVNAPGFSTSTFVDYRCIWRVEAVLEHAPVYGIGSFQAKHFDLPLVRYDVPPHEPTSQPVLNLQTNKPKAPRLLYCVHSPTIPVGPRDLLSIPVFIQPLEPGVIIRSLSLTIERRIQFKENRESHRSRGILTASSSLPTSPSSSSFSSSSASITSYHEHGLTLGAMTSTTVLIPKPDSTARRQRPSTAPVRSRFSSHTFGSSRAISDLITGTESSGGFSRDRSGIWSNVLTLQWPAPKSHSRWAVGETIQSNLVSVKFFVHVKVVVSSHTGADSIELAEKELLVVATGDEARKMVISKHVTLPESRSPRRSRKGHQSEAPSTFNHNGQAAASPGASKLRRPHTSAATTTSSAPLLEGIQTLSGPNGDKQEAAITIPLSSKPTGPNSADRLDGSREMREWEEELARIESRSRRSSELLGFPWRRRRSLTPANHRD